MSDELDKNLKKAVSETDINKLLKIIKSPSMDSIPKDLQDIAKQLGKSIQKKEMGGEVIDMTKAQPVGMMDGGKVKKMNMGGVIGGRGGKFKGMR
jgi:hypothetical protein